MPELYSADIETTGLLHHLKEQGSEAKLHNMGFKHFETGDEILFQDNVEGARPLSELQAFLDEGHTVVMHNGICYDAVALQMLGYNLDPTKIIDTMLYSQYLYPRRTRHGLAEWGEEFGVPKPAIDDWQNLPPAEYGRRVLQDCRIQHKLWQQMHRHLTAMYPNTEDRLGLMKLLWGKQYALHLQERTRWKLDVPLAESLSIEWTSIKEERHEALSKVMPEMPKYTSKSKPSKPIKMNGALSRHGWNWLRFCVLHDVDFDDEGEYEIVSSYMPGNPNSYPQLKAWLFSLGWEPETFVYKREEDGSESAIPQVNIPKSGGALDPGVFRLVEDHPVLEKLTGFAIIRSRLGVVNGWLENHIDGFLVAGAANLTNTLRLRHRGVTNVPGIDKPYGLELRSCLRAEEGEVHLGSDLSSLEDRCKHHFQIPIDPEYVKTQMENPDFDPHLEVAFSGGLCSRDDILFYAEMDKLEEVPEEHKARVKSIAKVRKLGKAGNYGCQYGARPPRLARDAKIPLEVGQKVFDGYWDLNWSIKTIAEGTRTMEHHGYSWQWNPISHVWYHLKAQKDRFSTLCQGTGAYVFDIWVQETIRISNERWGRDPKLNGQFHDEVIVSCKNSPKAIELTTKLLDDAMDATNAILNMNRDMACDTQVGNVYADIH